jgi:hypothetical protein
MNPPQKDWSVKPYPAVADAVPVGYWGPPDGIPVGAANGFDAAVLAPDGWTVADEPEVERPLEEEAAEGPHPAINAAAAASNAP